MQYLMRKCFTLTVHSPCLLMSVYSALSLSGTTPRHFWWPTTDRDIHKYSLNEQPVLYLHTYIRTYIHMYAIAVSYACGLARTSCPGYVPGLLCYSITFGCGVRPTKMADQWREPLSGSVTARILLQQPIPIFDRVRTLVR